MTGYVKTMKMTILGCGTSGGVPRIGRQWGDCDPNEPKNRRRRVSILVQRGATNVIVDTSPDFREQCLDAGIDHLDAVLYTHDHADHTHGIDDLRGFFYLKRSPIPAYGDAQTLSVLNQRFPYVFDGTHGYPAIAEAREINGALKIGELDVMPFRQGHGPITSLGFRFGPLAYSTDLDALDEAAFAALEGIDIWIVDALRYDPHPTHAHLERTLAWIERVAPRRAILTHMNWEMDYQTLRRQLPAGVEPAYDGLAIEFDS